MGKPSSLAQNGLHDTRNSTTARNAFWDILLLPNPALVFIAWCPTVWTTCLACHTSGKSIQAAVFFTLLLKNFVIISLIYSCYCVLNNLCNGESDEERTQWRTAFLSVIYLSRALGTVSAVFYLQGQDFLPLWLPCFVLSSFYPLAKRFKLLGQFILASVVVSTLLPAWLSSGGKVGWREDVLLVAAFTFFWIIYISVLHSAMDTTNTALASTHYLSPSPLTHLTLTLLSLLQLTTLSISSYQTAKSPHFWILGVGVWVVNNVWHIADLRNLDWLWNEMSGTVAVQRNIYLGLWMAGAEVCELWVRGGLGF